ncbi:MAG: YitT family protein [Oscillospiraceae bacterium]|nr:YitT family protein [Oscillospiraceae bacterium]
MNIVKRIKSELIRYMIIIVGIAMVAFAVAVFYTPNKIVSGGVSGIATILYHTLHINQGYSFFAINVVLLLVSIKPLGIRFVLDTLWISVLLSVFVELFSHIPPVTNDVFVALIFGAILYGLGAGLTLIKGASSGGTDILARLVQKVFPNAKIGSLLLAVDLVVIFSSLLVFKVIDLSLYGIIALSISSFSIDFLIKRLNVSKLAFVVTDKGEEIARHLVSHSPRGVTIIESRGGYTMHNNNVLMCALKGHEVMAFQNYIHEIDPDAFIIFSESLQIVGNGFKVYK